MQAVTWGIAFELVGETALKYLDVSEKCRKLLILCLIINLLFFFELETGMCFRRIRSKSTYMLNKLKLKLKFTCPIDEHHDLLFTERSHVTFLRFGLQSHGK